MTIHNRHQMVLFQEGQGLDAHRVDHAEDQARYRTSASNRYLSPDAIVRICAKNTKTCRFQQKCDATFLFFFPKDFVKTKKAYIIKITINDNIFSMLRLIILWCTYRVKRLLAQLLHGVHCAGPYVPGRLPTPADVFALAYAPPK